jgi:uncharacterized protein (TIGR02147 family)
MKKCFEFDDYKVFLAEVEASRAQVQRGFRTKLAEGLGVQNAYVSKVLNGEAHFSLEQGVRLCEFLGLDGDERQYLIWLLEHARAGTKELKNFFRSLLNELREKHLNIKKRVGNAAALSAESQATYYSQWYYGAIHALVSVPGFDSVESLGRALGLDRKKIEEAVLFLVDCGMLDQKKGGLVTGATQIHLDRSSPNISKHHTNWRMRAIESLSSGDEFDIHYSAISSLSKADVEKIRAMVVKSVQEYVETVRPSKEETLYSFTMDFFKVGKF